MLYNQNLLRNGDLTFWDTNIPQFMDTQETNTTGLRLRSQFPEEDGRRTAWTEIAGTHGDVFIYSGRDALRETLTSSASADDFRIGPEGMSLTAFTGAVPEHVKVGGVEAAVAQVDGGVGGVDRFVFAFVARSDQTDTQLSVRIIARNTADGVELYLQEDGLWETSDTGRYTFGIQPRWHGHSLYFTPPLGNANDVIEHFVWEIANVTAGAQIIDIGEIRIENLSSSRGAV